MSEFQVEPWWYKEHLASIWKRLGINFIKFLVDTGLHLNTLNVHGKSMLHYAAELGNLEITYFLINNKADFTLPNINGETPLHIAAMYGQTEIVKLLVSRGVPVNIRSESYKLAPLHSVSLSYLYESRPENYHGVLYFLINSYADINAVDCFGRTAMIIAASRSCEKTVEIFIKNGVNVFISDNNNCNLLHFSCAYGWFNIVKYLICLGLDINSKDNKGRSPLFWAINYGPKNASKINIIEFLIKFGAESSG